MILKCKALEVRYRRGVISQEAVTGPRYIIKDKVVWRLWKGFLFSCRGDSLPSHSSKEVLPG